MRADMRNLLTIPLEGTWQLHCKEREISINAEVPGDNHSALLAAGLIEDPYWAADELKAFWAGEVDWAYERQFEVSAEFLREASIFLNCDSIDTVAAVFINGKKVGDTRNAFVRYRFEVKEYLQVGVNTVRIEIESPDKAALAESKKVPYPIPHTEWPYTAKHRNFIRKCQCHAGWDWGPRLLVSGIYGRIYLGAASQGRIENVTTDQEHGADGVTVTVHCEVVAAQAGETDFRIELDGQVVETRVTLVPGSNRLCTTVHISKPKLWWPNGYGVQHLYDLAVSAGGDTVKKSLGLRTIEVVHGEDEHGSAMVFVVNGVPVFCKGANWIPCDAFPQCQSREVMAELLTSAVQAHMNMIRVWGGGQYESDEFYDLCDEKGLLIWHDFMFACALYPATPEFLGLVRQEAEYQVQRLRDHASIALWCGNNEDLGALGWYPESRANRDRYLVDYDRLNEGVLGNTARALDPTRIFWPSSPCGGPGDYSDCWHDDTRGDMHAWGVWHEGKSFETYLDITPRFCSEFGYQSFPSMETVRSYAPEDQRNVTSPVMEHHQRNPGGNTRITENFARYFRFPEGFANFVFLSQIQQALAIKTAVEHFRRSRPVCMGAVYWQLNDNWPVCSWSSLEYGGKWKVLHYAAQRFYAPLLVSAVETKAGDIEVWGNNDRLEPVSGKLSLRVMDFSGKILRTEQFDASIGAASATRLAHYPVTELAADLTSVFLAMEFTTTDGMVRNNHFFCEYKKCELLKPEIIAEVSGQADKLSVTLSAKHPAFWVNLEVSGIPGIFEDNGFTLLPGEPRTVSFIPKKPGVSLDKFQKLLTVESLRSTYV